VPFLPEFSGILLRYLTNQNLWGARASPPLTPLRLWWCKCSEIDCFLYITTTFN